MKCFVKALKRIFHAHNPRNNLNLKTVISTKVYDYLLQREATELVACSKSAGNSRFGNKDFQVLKNVIDTDRFVYRLEDRRYIREKLHIEKKVVVLVYNYGTKLQAYAMQTLLEQNGERCEIIQWHKRNFGIFNRVVDQYKVLKKIYVGFGKRMKYWPKVMERYKKFDDFNSKFHIHKYYGDLDEMKECVSKYSHVFCGSDQAWLPSNVEKHWYTLEFCNSNQVRAAYAPSFGVDRIEDSKLNAYKQFLSLFDYLSVREISGQKIIKKILEKDVPVVLDPTLLLERNYWDRLLKEATVCIPKQPYCFCYFLGNNKKHRESVKHLSQHKDYKIVNLQHFSGFCEADVDFADENLYAVSPQDFIALIANADYVCTDSFHCTAFSIQYEKNFTVFHRFEKKDKNSTNTRLYSLLEQLNLGTRIIDDGQDIIPNAVDYSICNNLLEKQRVISSEYLQEALRARKKF